LILTAHQPAYLPWLGYFNKIMRSDLFIYLDSVQFEKNSFTNRNKIKTPQGEIWLTVPIKSSGHFQLTIKDIQIDNRQNWRKKHLNSIYCNYKKAASFEQCYAKLEKLYQKDYDFLADLCYDQLLFWFEELNITTTIIRSSELTIRSKKSDLVLDLCKYFNVDHYLSGAQGKNYLKENDFKKNHIFIEYQSFQHPTYPQLWGEFLPFMSVVDFWFNCGTYEQ
jgi:hypothetical protein